MNNRDISRIKNDNSEDKILFIINGFKKYKITHLTRPNELDNTTSKVTKGTRTQLGSRTTTCSKLLLGRTNRTRLHCFLQRTDAVHPRRKSGGRQDNMEQRRSAGIYLPKSNVMLDMVLICTEQSQDKW